MNGAVEEGGQTARTLITSLKDNPLLLGVLVLNVIFIGMVTWASMNVATARDVIMKQLIDSNSKAQEMLSRCIVPQKSSDIIPHE